MTSAQRLLARSGWPALVVSVAARAILSVLISLLCWSLAPVALGWHPTVVMTGSMRPELAPGDVVVSRPVASQQLAVGQVLLVDSPDRPGELRLHRLVRFSPDGTLVLRGDANRTADSSPVARSAVHGVGALHIPFVGRPFLWAATGQSGPLVSTALALAALLALAFWWRPAPADEPRQDADPDGRAAMRQPTPAPAARRRLIRMLIVAGTAAAVVVTNTGAANAATRYTAGAGNPTNSWSASTWFNCANAVAGDGAASALPLSESGGTTAADVSGNNAPGIYSASGVTYGVTGPCAHDNRTAVTLDGAAGKIVDSALPGNTAMSFEIWFKTTGGHGGVLMSMMNNGGQSKVALAMTSTGTLTFANGSTSAMVNTTTSYNDGLWHLAVASVGSSGMALYVDLRAAVTSTASSSVAGSATTVNIGYGKASTLNTGSNDYFQGSLAFATWYAKALTAAQVAAHYAAAS